MHYLAHHHNYEQKTSGKRNSTKEIFKNISLRRLNQWRVIGTFYHRDADK